MNRRLRLSLLTASACVVLAACSTEQPAPAPSGGFVDVPAVTPATKEIPRPVEQFATGMTDAMAWYAETPTMSYEEFMAGFTALWLETALNGVEVTRMPVTEFQESIVEPDAVNLPGINYFIEANHNGSVFCVADTQVLYVPDITREQYEASRSAPSEYAAVAGSCEPYILTALTAVTEGIEVPDDLDTTPSSPTPSVASPQASTPSSASPIANPSVAASPSVAPSAPTAPSSPAAASPTP